MEKKYGGKLQRYKGSFEALLVQAMKYGKM